MKIILKKPLRFTVITTLCLVVVTLFAANGCDKSENPSKTCNVENPLTDLSWLKEVIDGFEYDAVTLGYNPHARIYQCSYKNGIGFLLEMCVGCPDYGYWFRNCEGESLCILEGVAGNSCIEFEIDFKNKQLIWEKKENIMNNLCEFENPLTDLPWLKAKVEEIVSIVQSGNPLSVSIYQCIYGNGETGFLVDEGNMKPFYNCEGEVLCIMGGFAGETCSELNIVSQELIWKTNN